MALLPEILKLAAAKILVEEEIEQEIADWRMGICFACPVLDKKEIRCKACKCFMEVKTKAKTNFNPKKLRYEITHCPMGKWSDLELANEYRKIDGLAPINS
jgi:hypothetical protein